MTQEPSYQPRLEALRAPCELDPTGLRALHAAAPVDAVLGEIDETLLGRSLAFASDTGRALTLDVAGRRVLRISHMDSSKGNRAAIRLIGREINEADQYRMLADVIADFAQDAKDCKVTPKRLANPASSASAGVKVAKLKALFDEDAAPVQETRFGPVLAQMGADVSAWITLRDGAIVSKSGGNETLETFALAEHATLKAHLEAQSGGQNGFLILTGTQGAGVFAMLKDGDILAGLASEPGLFKLARFDAE